MKTITNHKLVSFENTAAQGELYIVRVEALPDNVVLETPKDRVYIIGHSETGHHHVIKDTHGLSFYKTTDPFTCYLSTENPVALEHLRDFDTHSSLVIKPGKYVVRYHREIAPECWNDELTWIKSQD